MNKFLEKELDKDLMSICKLTSRAEECRKPHPTGVVGTVLIRPSIKT